MHKREDEVATAIKLPAKEQQQMLKVIKHKGDNEHNKRVTKEGGVLALGRRQGGSHPQRDPSDYYPCPRCFILVLKKNHHRYAEMCVIKSMLSEQ